MTFLVFGFIIAAITIAAAGLVAVHRALATNPHERAAIRRLTATDRAEIERLTVPLAPARQDLTDDPPPPTGPASHRSEQTAGTPLSYVPRHQFLDVKVRWATPVIDVTQEFNMLIAAEYGQLVAA